MNHIIIDHHSCTVVAKEVNFNLLHSQTLVPHPDPIPFAAIQTQKVRSNILIPELYPSITYHQMIYP